MTDNERAALLWLLDGNGQKCIQNKALTEGPFRGEHNILRMMCHDLQARGFVTVGHPNYFGVRWVNLTDAGRMALEADDEQRRAAAKSGGET